MQRGLARGPGVALAGAAALCGLACAAAQEDERPAPRPIVIAHRGASGELPEHTLAAYERAIEAGARWIEPDLVMTRDGVLVARHEAELSATTDVAARSELAARRATKSLDGSERSGWFSEDLDLDELRGLRARERWPELRPESAAHDGRFPVPTFDEVLELAARHGAGVAPELKHPAHFRALGLEPEEALARSLRAGGFGADRVLVQSFDPEALARIGELGPWPRMQGLGEESLARGRSLEEQLAEIATWAESVGAAKALVLPRDEAGRLAREPTGLVAAARRAGLEVHAWTFRAENRFLPAELRSAPPGTAAAEARHGDLAAEIARFLDAGIDGLFTDHPAQALAAVERWSAARAR